MSDSFITVVVIFGLSSTCLNAGLRTENIILLKISASIIACFLLSDSETKAIDISNLNFGFKVIRMFGVQSLIFPHSAFRIRKAFSPMLHAPSPKPYTWRLAINIIAVNAKGKAFLFSNGFNSQVQKEIQNREVSGDLQLK